MQKCHIIIRNSSSLLSCAFLIINKSLHSCVSVNECVCHNSPLESDVPGDTLSSGDLVKLDLGCYVDGYIAVAAHTMVCGCLLYTSDAADE